MSKPRNQTETNLEFLALALSDPDSGEHLLRALHRSTKGDPQLFRLTVSVAAADWIREGKSEPALARVFLSAAVGARIQS